MAVELYSVYGVRMLQNATDASRANRDAGQGKKNRFAGIGGHGRNVAAPGGAAGDAEQTRARDGRLGKYVDELI